VLLRHTWNEGVEPVCRQAPERDERTMGTLGHFRSVLAAHHGLFRWRTAVLAALVVSTAGWMPAQAQPGGNDWPGYVHDLADTGFTNETLITPANAATLKPRTGWPVMLANGAGCPSSADTCSNLIAAQPMVATVGGATLVFIGSWNGNEYALCAQSCSVGGKTYASGQVVWSRYLGRTSGCGGPYNSHIHGITTTAMLADEVIGGVNRTVVYVGGAGDITFSGGVLTTGTAQVFALDALTGAVIWHQSVGSAPSHYLWSSPRVANGSVYIGLASMKDCPLVQGQLLQLDATAGQVTHTFAVVPAGCTGGGIWGSATLDASGAVYVATGNQGTCTSTEPSTVAVLKFSSTLTLQGRWQIPAAEQTADGDFGSTPTLFTGTVSPGAPQRSLVGIANKNGLLRLRSDQYQRRAGRQATRDRGGRGLRRVRPRQHFAELVGRSPALCRRCAHDHQRREL
jgi:outer membrane protein assembly factor BamB